jgi:hypothetical protein
MPSESGSGRGSPAVSEWLEPRVPAGRGDPCNAGGKEVAGGGEPCRRRDVIEVVKVWGQVIGPGWRLRREPGPKGSVLERKSCSRS